MKIIDMHTHLGKFAHQLVPGTADELLRAMDRAGIEQACASSIQGIAYDMISGNAEVAREIKGHEDRLHGYVFLSPNYRPQAPEELRRHLDAGFIGLKMYSGSYVGQPLDCPAHEEYVGLLAEEYPGKIVLFHCGENDPTNYRRLARLANLFPTVTFLAGHTGSALWRQALAEFRELPNILAELSAPVPARCRVEDCVRALGAERVVFGSDWPVSGMAYELGALHDAEVSEEERARVGYGNGKRLLGAAS